MGRGGVEITAGYQLGEKTEDVKIEVIKEYQPHHSWVHLQTF